MEEIDVSDSSDTDDSERLGERLFSLVEELDPRHANYITGELRLIHLPRFNIFESLLHFFLCKSSKVSRKTEFPHSSQA